MAIIITKHINPNIQLENEHEIWRDISPRGNTDGQTYMKRCSALLTINRKYDQSYNDVLPWHQSELAIIKMSEEITNFGEVVEKTIASYTVGGNLSLCSHCGRQYGSFSENLK